MFQSKNKFGEGEIYEASDLKGNIYITCTACMSIWSEALTWANANKDRIVHSPEEADSIIVLSCQVTDLAVLNDLHYLEQLMTPIINEKFLNESRHNDEWLSVRDDQYPGFYIGGCLAKRFDIDLPDNVKRLDNVKEDYQSIDDKSLVHFEKPFWVKDFIEGQGEGNLFRDMYPLRIGVGCKGKCKYCTIRVTRGDAYQLPINAEKEAEFLEHDDVVLIADSPTSDQINEWCLLALAAKKSISIRNLEPGKALKCTKLLMTLAKEKLLKLLHVPIQSSDPRVLKDMGRNPDKTLNYLDLAYGLKFYDTQTATNIIIDYKNFRNTYIEDLKDIFDYVSWNPYWDGTWDRQTASTRFKKYIR